MFCRNAEDWVFTLSEDHSWASGLAIPFDADFYDKDNVKRLEIRRDGTITVLAKYSWDGCTPKFCFFDLVLGIPDGVVDSTTKHPRTYFASLIHDALYQFRQAGLPLSRWQTDVIFLHRMNETRFYWRYLYFAAVAVFGGAFGLLGRLLRRNRGRMVVVNQ